MHVRKKGKPHPEEPLSGKLSSATVQALAADGTRTIGDLQLLTESELKAVPKVGRKRVQEVQRLFAGYDDEADVRFRRPKEHFHHRARQVFAGTGHAYISARFLRALGKERVAQLAAANHRSIGAVTRLSREEIDEICETPLSDNEVERLRKEIRQLGLEPHVR